MAARQPSERLRDVAAQLRGAVTSRARPDERQLVSRINWLAEVLESTATLLSSRRPGTDYELALLDAAALASQLNGAEAESPVIQILLDRAGESAARLHATAHTEATLERHGDADDLGVMVDAYGQDARQVRRVAALLVGFATACAVAAAVVVYVAAGASEKGGRLALGQFLARASVGMLVLLFGLALLAVGARQLRAAREVQRLQRQLAGLGPYLSPLPQAANHLMRMTMIQRLFPRLLEDNDPLREAKWPDAEVVIRVLSPPPNTNAGDGTTANGQPR
jgi:protein-S-isoprenylcysteine O-methyltransferase Ste14